MVTQTQEDKHCMFSLLWGSNSKSSDVSRYPELNADDLRGWARFILLEKEKKTLNHVNWPAVIYREALNKSYL